MNDNINKMFGARIVALRKKAGITQEELSFRCGIHRAYMGTIERGEKSVTLDTVVKIANGLNIEIKELFDFQHI
ncbi:helix-turn-helix domain-containing protein [Marseilla massiliensis]|mgnify:FL=1|uniref:Helix-turn-helix transcriptional regulator n=1 Tax=Marseilla massiliensis TaxID=1841864 RepID=A0A939B6Q4_9BACT|nr:helix-turn-helix transcriptional regulator [Marseilla massiliensis]MBM6674529.1 helix-turn-helix transcriptional regulator [Marseilla massiliensis]